MPLFNESNRLAQGSAAFHTNKINEKSNDGLRLCLLTLKQRAVKLDESNKI